MAFANYELYKIQQFQKPYKQDDDAFKDRLNLDFQDIAANYATEAWVQSQIATGGVDWSTFGDPNDVLKLNAAGDTPEGLTYEELAALLDPYITGGGGGSYNESNTRLYIGNPTTSNSTIYTASAKIALSSIRLNNSTGDAQTNIKLGITPSGGSQTNILDIDLDGTTKGITYHEFPQIILNLNDTIQTQAGSDGIFTLILSESIIDLSAHNRMFIAAPSTVKTTIYTATSNIVLKNFRLNNSTSSANGVSFYLGITPNGGTEKSIIDTTYDSGKVLNEELNLKLFTGDTVQIQAGTNSVFFVTATGKAV